MRVQALPQVIEPGTSGVSESQNVPESATVAEQEGVASVASEAKDGDTHEPRDSGTDILR